MLKGQVRGKHFAQRKGQDFVAFVTALSQSNLARDEFRGREEEGGRGEWLTPYL
ncbi:hypothetical protein CBOM_01102 [Ceraceosorus bombacis]|uniref:Uncharacterized protein n=1 Tax=Ceraceosorus bombacis TaxID=401625 RepID=A0A0N7L995_9BASI|nr:hypothetical protein CBOM_01102 [Ceraceosorus bombacis]